MKKITFLIALLSITFGAFSQDDYDISFDAAVAKIVLPAAIKPLDESVKYYVELQENLTYYKGNRAMLFLRNPAYTLKLDAKKVKTAEEADYVFRFSSPGIKTFTGQTGYVSFERAATYYTTAGIVKGYVYKVRYLFPITLEIVNKGTVEKTLHFNTDTATCEYHVNFLLDPYSTEDHKPSKLLKPFASEKDASESFKKNEEEIYKRMEFNTWINTLEYAEQLLKMAFSDYKLPESYFYSKVLTKKGKAALPAIADLVNKQFVAIGDLDDDNKKAASLETLKQLLNSYDSLIANIGSYGPKVQRVILSNAAWCALLSGQTERAPDLFTRYYMIENDEYKMFGPFKATFAVYHDRDIITQPATAVEPDNNVDFLTPPKTAATVNIDKQDGQVEKTDGEIIKGKISIDYAPKPGGIMDADLGKAATVYFTKNGSETYQFAKVNNTKRILVGERIFEPVLMKKSALVGVFNAAAGDVGSTYFMEKMHEKNGFVVYRFWYPSETLFIKFKDQRAIELQAVINQRKLAQDIFDACPQLKEWIKSASLKNNLDNAKKIIDYMAGSCQ
jgi:hypothetical protein